LLKNSGKTLAGLAVERRIAIFDLRKCAQRNTAQEGKLSEGQATAAAKGSDGWHDDSLELQM
jgi:hypothetical protein